MKAERSHLPCVIFAALALSGCSQKKANETSFVVGQWRQTRSPDASDKSKLSALERIDRDTKSNKTIKIFVYCSLPQETRLSSASQLIGGYGLLLRIDFSRFGPSSLQTTFEASEEADAACKRGSCTAVNGPTYPKFQYDVGNRIVNGRALIDKTSITTAFARQIEGDYRGLKVGIATITDVLGKDTVVIPIPLRSYSTLVAKIDFSDETLRAFSTKCLAAR